MFYAPRKFSQGEEEYTSVFGAKQVELNPTSLKAFLRFGYVPSNFTLWKNVQYRPQYLNVAPLEPFKGLRSFETAIDLLRRAIEVEWGSGDHIVPLSGGYDSRLLLALLREWTPLDRVRTVTYGLPGTADYELGNRVAKSMGTNHTSLDLSQFDITYDRLWETALLSDGNTDLFQPVVWTHIFDAVGRNGTFWSGFTGDGIAGSHHYTKNKTVSISEARLEFLSFGSRTIKYFRPNEYLIDVLELLRIDPFFEHVLDLREACFFSNHVERYTAHQIFMSGVRYATPFMCPDVMSYFMSLPAEQRDNKKFFNAMCENRFPTVFDWPTTCVTEQLRSDPLGASGFREIYHAGWDTAKRILYRIPPLRVRHPKTTYWGNPKYLSNKDCPALIVDLLDSLMERDIELLPRSKVRGLLARWEREELIYPTITLLASLEVILQVAEARMGSKKDVSSHGASVFSQSESDLG